MAARKPFECLNLAKEKKIRSVTCGEILAAFEGKLIAKFDLPTDQAKESADEVRKISDVVTIEGKMEGTSDPGDNRVLECAVTGKATHVITGDRRHLLPLKVYHGIEIVTADDFLKLFDDEEHGKARAS